jgi:hypothetical protein
MSCRVEDLEDLKSRGGRVVRRVVNKEKGLKR